MKNNVENLNLNREEDRIIDQQLLVMMIGIPGSGKSFFARQLTEKLNAERLNMDLLRRELFGTKNRWDYKELIKGEDFDRVAAAQKARETFDEKLESALKNGQSIVIDASQNRKFYRGLRRNLAAEFGVQTLVVWMSTPEDISIERAITREKTSDQHPFIDREAAEKEINRYLENWDPPQDDEFYIEMDGRISFADQYKKFYELYERVIVA